MGLFDKHKICLFSEVTGVVTKDGKPVVGAEIVRRGDLFLPKDQVYTDSTLTNAEGRFDFKPLYAKRWKPLMTESRVDQKIFVRHEGKEYLGWTNVSDGRDLHADVREPGLPEGFYFRLDFNGDLSRATPLAEDVDRSRLMGSDEGFFNSQMVYVCSYLHFFVTMNGEPAVGAKVVRTAEHVGYDSYEQTKLTDIDGEIELPALCAPLFEHAWAKTEIRQKVVISYQGKEYLGWEKTKTNPWRCGEYNLDGSEHYQLPVRITAELSDDQNAIRGVKTEPDCWKDDILPDDAILYKGLFQVTRFDPGIVKE